MSSTPLFLPHYCAGVCCIHPPPYPAASGHAGNPTTPATWLPAAAKCCRVGVLLNPLRPAATCTRPAVSVRPESVLVLVNWTTFPPCVVIVSNSATNRGASSNTLRARGCCASNSAVLTASVLRYPNADSSTGDSSSSSLLQCCNPANVAHARQCHNAAPSAKQIHAAANVRVNSAQISAVIALSSTHKTCSR